jgi:hypothetical protein
MVSYKCPKCGGNRFRISGEKRIYCDNEKCLTEVGKAVITITSIKELMGEPRPVFMSDEERRSRGGFFNGGG